jgi:RHS repeat-associated protein
MQNEKYNFDPNGNRKTAEIQGQKQTYKTGEYNRLLSDENYNYEYDTEGNRISKTDKESKTTKYFWDHRNRLIKVTTPTTEVKYLYDYLNRLVKRTENLTKHQQYFVHDDCHIILQVCNGEYQSINRYLWGTKQDELLCDNENWMLNDYMHTIRDIVKPDGETITHWEYNAFGKLLSEIDKSVFFAYTGKLRDRENNLQWNINRWYDSNVGRWVSDDSIGFDGYDVNITRYAYNISTVLVDHSGDKVSIHKDAECFLIDWLNSHSINNNTHYRISRNNNYSNFTIVTGTVQYNNSVDKEIAYKMLQLSREFKVKGVNKNNSKDNWLGHISARKNIIARANTSSFSYGNQGTTSKKGAIKKKQYLGGI